MRTALPAAGSASITARLATYTFSIASASPSTWRKSWGFYSCINSARQVNQGQIKQVWETGLLWAFITTRRPITSRRVGLVLISECQQWAAVAALHRGSWLVGPAKRAGWGWRERRCHAAGYRIWRRKPRPSDCHEDSGTCRVSPSSTCSRAARGAGRNNTDHRARGKFSKGSI